MTVFLIGAVWIGSVVLFFTVNFYERRNYFRKLYGLLEDLDNRYLISEVMEPPNHLEDRMYREILRKTNKSVIEKINKLEDAQRNYREYIEAWIHETKLPLTAAVLICENNKNQVSKLYMRENMLLGAVSFLVGIVAGTELQQIVHSTGFYVLAGWEPEGYTGITR